jgi:hypothetical protein
VAGRVVARGRQRWRGLNGAGGRARISLRSAEPRRQGERAAGAPAITQPTPRPAPRCRPRHTPRQRQRIRRIAGARREPGPVAARKCTAVSATIPCHFLVLGAGRRLGLLVRAVARAACRRTRPRAVAGTVYAEEAERLEPWGRQGGAARVARWGHVSRGLPQVRHTRTPLRAGMREATLSAGSLATLNLMTRAGWRSATTSFAVGRE